MQEIFAYLGGIAVAVFAMEMLLSLLPDGNMKRFVRMAVGILLATLLLSPVGKLIGGWDPFYFSMQEQTQGEEISEKSYEEMILDVYHSSLENKNE